jgi:hypothetical protein
MVRPAGTDFQPNAPLISELVSVKTTLLGLKRGRFEIPVSCTGNMIKDADLWCGNLSPHAW